MILVVLPWPAPPLWVNRKAHWSKRARFATAARNEAYMATVDACGGVEGAAEVRERLRAAGQIAVSITFYPPDARRRDLDGMLSACKPALDGISDALGVNDERFGPVVLERAPVTDGGKVVVGVVVPETGRSR